MDETLSVLAPSEELTTMGIMHLKRYWQKCLLDRNGRLAANMREQEWMTDNTLLSVLGLSLYQASAFLYDTTPSLTQFENWIAATAGNPDVEKIKAFNRLICEGPSIIQRDETDAIVLTKDDMDHWDRHGYVILRNAIAKEDCAAGVHAICEYLGIDQYDTTTWYLTGAKLSGIMVHIFQHPVLQKIRNTQRIRIAFEQLWKRKDLWLKIDSAGFNPPQTDDWQFPGHGLHWDVSLQPPIPFSTQGILYLTDTSEEQGAFSLVPGFHHKIDAWLASLRESADPRKEDLEALGVKRIGANAGDMIIWQQALPHGSSPNMSDKPRFAQYINYLPADRQIHPGWK